MTLLDAIILGIVEGLTEFLPVSSTGHLLITNSLLGLSGEAANAYAIVIQFGAIMAVAVYYHARLLQMAKGAFVAKSDGQRLILNLLIAFVPAAVVGLLFEDFIDTLMSWDGWIALALIVGGIVMIVVERLLPPEKRNRSRLEDITPMDAFVVGCAQCFALWPGMSRSMSTIVGGQLRGMTNSLAADFSFLLAIPTLGAATVYKAYSDREALVGAFEPTVMIVGIVVSFVVALAAIAGFLRLLKTIGLEAFGAYRIVVGVLVFALIWAEVIEPAEVSQMIDSTWVSLQFLTMLN
ncbi:MAG: undecaprenyl-diphosphate phosphatase [Sumerlaeia bacterium]